MKHFDQRLKGRHLIRMGFHQVLHVVPPLSHNLQILHPGRRVVVGQLLEREQDQRFFVEVDSLGPVELKKLWKYIQFQITQDGLSQGLNDFKPKLLGRV